MFSFIRGGRLCRPRATRLTEEQEQDEQQTNKQTNRNITASFQKTCLNVWTVIRQGDRSHKPGRNRLSITFRHTPGYLPSSRRVSPYFGRCQIILPGEGKCTYTWYSASSWIITSEALRCGTCSQGISQFYLHTHTFICNQNEPYLHLPSQL